MKCICLRMDYFEGGNEYLGYVKGRKFLEEMVNCYSLKKFASWFLNRNF